MSESSSEDVDLGPLPDLIGYVIRRAQLAVFEDFDRRFAALDLRPAEFSMLLVIDRNEGLTQRRVADALGIRPSNLVAMVARLAARGVIEQRSDARDRRAVILHLTSAGRALLGQGMAAARQHDAAMTAGFTAAEHARLLTSLRMLAAESSTAPAMLPSPPAKPATRRSRPRGPHAE